jgi:hypothetical protein
MVSAEDFYRLPSCVNIIEDVELGWLWRVFHIGTNKSGNFYVRSKRGGYLEGTSVDMFGLYRVRNCPWKSRRETQRGSGAMPPQKASFRVIGRGVPTLKSSNDGPFPPNSEQS